MKLGKPRCYTLFKNNRQHNQNLGGSGNSGGGIGLNFLPFSRGRNYRHMLQVFIMAVVFCLVILCQVSLMTVQSSSSPPGNAAGDDFRVNNALSNGGNVLCESCDNENNAVEGTIRKTNVVSNENNSVGTDNLAIQRDSHLTPDFAQETSGGNYYYLYNDENPDEIDTTKRNINNSQGLLLPDLSLKRDTKPNNNNNNVINDLRDKSVGNAPSVPLEKSAIKNKKRNKLGSSHYQKRKKLLDSVFLSVKTTQRFHSSRLEPILKTWFNLAKEQTWIFTDADDPALDRRTNGHVINTNCPSTHYRQALCCKMSAEFDTFIQSKKSWFCHFDDDNYVNVPALLDLLSRYDHKEYWYLGKPSLKKPIHFLDPDTKVDEVSFWFGTGGAGFCVSRALALRMSPLASGGKFTKLCDKIQLPDDVTIGYVAGHLLGQNLTVIPQFHSHFETMKFINMKNPHPEITFSYVRYAEHVNILDVQGFFTEEEDPTRFLSLHCRLFPNFSFCPKGLAKR